MRSQPLSICQAHAFEKREDNKQIHANGWDYEVEVSSCSKQFI